MDIISKARIEDRPDTFGLFFARRGDESGGYCFDCDEAGTLAPMTDCQRDSLREALNGAHYHAPVVQRYMHRRIRHAAVGRCDCGAEVVLDGFTNTCEECGADYNSSGQRLAARSQWGEETGESLGDILRI